MKEKFCLLKLSSQHDLTAKLIKPICSKFFHLYLQLFMNTKKANVSAGGLQGHGLCCSTNTSAYHKNRGKALSLPKPLWSGVWGCLLCYGCREDRGGGGGGLAQIDLKTLNFFGRNAAMWGDDSSRCPRITMTTSYAHSLAFQRMRDLMLYDYFH